MRRIIISNLVEKVNHSVHLYENMGYIKCFERTQNGVHVVGLDSKLEKSENIYVNDDDFVIISGTCLSKTKSVSIGEFVYNNFSDKVDSIREKLIGNYIICINKGNKLTFFTDDYSIGRFYYSSDNEHYIFTNSLYVLAKSKKNVSINKNALIEQCFQNGILGGDTIFNELYKLQGNQFVEVNPSNIKIGNLVEKSIEVDYSMDLNKRVSVLSKSMKKYFSLISESFPKINISMTGGLDSRLILAGFLSVGAKPILSYGQGNSSLTNTKDEDLEIVRTIANKYNLEFIRKDWSSDSQDDSTLISMIDRYQDFFSIYSANEKILMSFRNEEENEKSFFEFGYFGEMYRNLEWLIDIKEENIKIKKLIDLYLYFDPNIFLKDSLSFKTYIRKKVESIINNYSDSSSISKDNFQKFHANYRYVADTQMNQYINSHSNSIIISGIPEIHRQVLSTPYEQKKFSALQIKLIHELYPSLLDVEIFSHTRKFKLDKNQFIQANSNKKNIFLNNILTEELKKNSQLYNLFKKIKMKLIKVSEKEKKEKFEYLGMKKNYVDKINEIQGELDLKVINPSRYYGDIRNLVRFYQTLFFIQKIKNIK